jgi:hypothetical protein
MVTAKSKIKDAKQLNGPTMCVRSGTATQENLTNFKAWMYRAIKAVGDYGEIFEKNVESRKDQSQIVEQNTPHEFFNHPKTDRSKDFLSKILGALMFATERPQGMALLVLAKSCGYKEMITTFKAGRVSIWTTVVSFLVLTLSE